MSFAEAMAAQPTWVVIWMNVLLLGGFILPVALLIWPETRLAGLFSLLGNAANAVALLRAAGGRAARSSATTAPWSAWRAR